MSSRAWYETLRPEERPEAASDRSFGLVAAAALAVFGGFSLWRGHGGGYWLLPLACVLLALSLLAPTVLAPINRLWAWLGLRLNAAVGLLVLALLFYGILTPIGLLMRLAGKDVLRLRFDAAAASYWTTRPVSEQRPDMTQQF